ncbi:uncharacterized protein LOC105216753 isoform X1 [Zeugodacus cucurbitae]|uniref:uncharacterized protein LOC105216753 isoform X1 n=1 Tax=Zeugodacus cucurbitae TaxID=28588 RepID=UPI0023D95837|nr:uncharacterized protein LOC105216753 isoform X1 [Zeugodacus cucurbitae]XP_054090581.1 uncharacterized protein LOC105216753 isoform X1 [Zeugodacus cucurbitae]
MMGNMMKLTLLQLLVLSLCVMVQHATSLPSATLTLPQAVESPSQQAAVAVAATAPEAENEVNKAVPSAVVTGAEVAVAAAQSLSILPADELPSRTQCGKVGDFCNLADDCCTKRCLTYAKRCVT